MKGPMKHVDAYVQLFGILRDKDLFANGPTHKIDFSKTTPLRKAISKASLELPGLYQDSYISPLLRNLEQTKARCSQATIETLSRAVLDHNHHNKERDVIPAIQGLLALISNIYRSFLTPEFVTERPLPQPRVTIPSLVMLRPRLNLGVEEFAPHILPAEEVERLCGAKVGVVCTPSNYRTQPALCWPALAHEIGGHDTLHAYDGLLWEIKYQVRQHFYKGPDPSGTEPENKDQFLGLLWDYWTEEAASDVCAILNLGPAYAMGVAVYLAALNERIRRYKELGKEGQARRGQNPSLTSSWPPSSDVSEIRPHPTDILKFQVMIGAINALRGLGDQDKKRYTKQIEDIVSYTLEANGSDSRTISISGWFQIKTGRWMHVEEGSFPIDRAEMEDGARKVGELIASAPFSRLNGNSLQALETWDSSDQTETDGIKKYLHDKTPHFAVGDDAQLMAASILALYENPTPEFYDYINENLTQSLVSSFGDDPVWGKESYHPIAGKGIGI